MDMAWLQTFFEQGGKKQQNTTMDEKYSQKNHDRKETM